MLRVMELACSHDTSMMRTCLVRGIGYGVGVHVLRALPAQGADIELHLALTSDAACSAPRVEGRGFGHDTLSLGMGTVYVGSRI